MFAMGVASEIRLQNDQNKEQVKTSRNDAELLAILTVVQVDYRLLCFSVS